MAWPKVASAEMIWQLPVLVLFSLFGKSELLYVLLLIMRMICVGGFSFTIESEFCE